MYQKIRNGIKDNPIFIFCIIFVVISLITSVILYSTLIPIDINKQKYIEKKININNCIKILINNTIYNNISNCVPYYNCIYQNYLGTNGQCIIPDVLSNMGKICVLNCDILCKLNNCNILDKCGNSTNINCINYNETLNVINYVCNNIWNIVNYYNFSCTYYNDIFNVTFVHDDNWTNKIIYYKKSHPETYSFYKTNNNYKMNNNLKILITLSLIITFLCIPLFVFVLYITIK